MLKTVRTVAGNRIRGYYELGVGIPEYGADLRGPGKADLNSEMNILCGCCGLTPEMCCEGSGAVGLEQVGGWEQ